MKLFYFYYECSVLVLHCMQEGMTRNVFMLLAGGSTQHSPQVRGGLVSPTVTVSSPDHSAGVGRHGGVDVSVRQLLCLAQI